MSFVNSNVIVLNNSSATHSFQTDVGSPLSIALPAGSTGTWTFVVNRAGYDAVYGTFDAAGGGIDTAAISQRWRQQPTGADLFSGSTQALITVSFTDAQCTIAIGDGTVTPQEVIDAVETALLTEAGMRFLASNVGSQSSFAIIGGQSFLLLGQAYRLARRASGDNNATLAGFAISTDGTPVDGVNGPVAYLSSAPSGGLSEATIAELIYQNSGIWAKQAAVRSA